MSLDGAEGNVVRKAVDKWGESGSSQPLFDTLASSEHDAGHLAEQLLDLLRSITTQERLSDDHVATALAQWVQLDQRATDDLEEQSPIAARESALLDAIWMLDQELGIYSQLVGQDGKLPISTERTRLNSLTSQLLIKQVISRTAAGARLEFEQLVDVGLVTSTTTYHRRKVQLNTGRLYKQEKFNLLREESEGFSKVFEVILAGMGAPLQGTLSERGTAMAAIAEPREQLQRRSARVWKHLLALIGYFDLEPARVLDIILDLFVSHVSRHYHFFLELLQHTFWGKDLSASDSPTSLGETAWLGSETGNYIMAQVLSFKLNWFSQGPIKGDAPYETFLVTALLIRHGLLSTRAIWPQLYSAEAMAEERKSYDKKLDDAQAEAGANPLAMAGALVDDDSPAETDDSKKPKAEVPVPKQAQLVGFTKACLALGMLRHASLVLARWPWLLGLYPELGTLYCRILRPIIRPAYHAMVPSAVFEPEPISPEGKQAIFVPRQWDKKGNLLAQRSPQCYLVPYIPPPDTINARFAFFYADWHTDLPRVCSFDEVLEHFVPLLNLLGPHLHYDTVLLQHVARVTAAGLRAQPPPSPKQDDHWDLDMGMDEAPPNPWLGILRNFLLPACSLSESSATILAELWATLSQLSYEQRFTIYGEWRYSIYKRKELKACQAKTEKEAKGILKRVSSDKNAQRIMGRKLAKAAHSNPTVFFSVALAQVQVYENLIDPIVETARYLADIENDIFTWSLLDALSNPAKQRMKTDGTNLAHWLKSLAAFAGTLYRRYSDIEPAPIIQYIVNQLHKNNPNDLVVIRELVLKMSGIEPLVNPADKQVAASAGGRLLRREAFIANDGAQGTPIRSEYNRSGERLLASATKSGMLVPLLILIAQCRDASIHITVSASASDQAPDAHIKFLAALFDSCNETLVQYAEFLATFLEPKQYAAAIPGLDALLNRFQIRPDVAWHLARPSMSFALESQRQEYRTRVDAVNAERERIMAERAKRNQRQQQAANGNTEKEGQAQQSDGTKSEAGTGETASGDQTPAVVSKEDGERDTDGDVPIANAKESKEATEPEPINDALADTPLPEPEEAKWWVQPLKKQIEVAERFLPEDFTALVSPQFYVTFWQLSITDLDVPYERYRQEMAQLNKNSTEPTRRSPVANALQKEQSTLRENQKDTSVRIRAERTAWFQPARSAVETVSSDVVPGDSDAATDPVQQIYDELAWTLHQACFFPRSVLSPIDAAFCARFLRILHLMGTEGVSTLSLYSRVFDSVRLALFVSTETEARNYARFLEAVLKDLDQWRKDATTYEKDAIPPTRPGFTTQWVGPKAGTKLSHSDYLRKVHQWHTSLFEAFASCIDSREYIRFKNTIMTLTRIAGLFPVLEEHGNELIAKVEKASQEETRGDLKVLLQGLLAVLRKHKKSWTSNMKGEKLQQVARPPTQTNPAAASTQVVRRSTAIKGGASNKPSPAPDAAPDRKATTPALGSRRGTPIVSERPNAGPSRGSSLRPEPSEAAPDFRSKPPDGREDRQTSRTQDRTESEDQIDIRAREAAAREAARASMRAHHAPNRDSPRGTASDAGSDHGHSRNSNKRSPAPSANEPSTKRQEPEGGSIRELGTRLQRRNPEDDKDSRSVRDKDRTANRDEPPARQSRDAPTAPARRSDRQDERPERLDRRDDRSGIQVTDQRPAFRLAQRERERERGRDDKDSKEPEHPSSRAERRAGRSGATTAESGSRASSPGANRYRERSNRNFTQAIAGVLPANPDSPGSSRKRGREREEPAAVGDDSHKRIKLENLGPGTTVKIRGRGSASVPSAPSPREQRDPRETERNERTDRAQLDSRDRERNTKDRARDQKDRDRERELRRRGARDSREDHRPPDRPAVNSYGNQLANAAAVAATKHDDDTRSPRSVEGNARWPDRRQREAPSGPVRDDRPERIDRRRQEDRDSSRDTPRDRTRDLPREATRRESSDQPARDQLRDERHGRDHRRGGGRKRRDRTARRE